MSFEALTGINGDLVTKSWMVSKRAYQTQQHYHKEEAGTIVFFSFRPSFLVKDWFSPANKSPFGEIEMKRNQFSCMRSIGNDVNATVNQAFLENLQLIISPSTSFHDSVKMAIERKQQIVFTGHSSGGATAILATAWYLETYYKRNLNSLPEPRCVTFGAPLVGDYIFKHALGRENWSRFFVNFVTRFDIVPRIMLARKTSMEQTLPHVLDQLDPTRASIQESENQERITEFYTTVMRDTSTVAYQAVCELIGNGDAFLETISSFLELSPYRPVGTFVFSTGERLVSVNNSDAILQILFYASQSRNEQEWLQIPNRSVTDHHRYEELVQSMGMNLNHLDLHHLLLDGDNSIVSALSDLGLSTRAKQCIHAALEAEKQREDNQKKIENKMPEIEERLKWIEEEYKPKCQAHKNGYYDSFKVSTKELDFNANVKRAELAGIFDEVLGLVKKGQLPDGFEVCEEWVKEATRYRRLIEPLDIANYHRYLKNEDTGPYMARGRPNRYKHAQRGHEHEVLKLTGMVAEDTFWRKVNALNLGSREEMEKKLKIAGSTCGSCFWAEIEDLKGKSYEEAEVRIKTLEGLLDGWIEEKEVDDEQIFLEGSTFCEWWNSLPHHHKLHSPLRDRIMSATRPN